MFVYGIPAVRQLIWFLLVDGSLTIAASELARIASDALIGTE
jgi:hypothetical protein